MIDLSSIAPGTVLLGCAMGLFAGLMPGLGYTTTLLLAFPLLFNMSILELLIIYLSVVTISIYVGSVPATLYGIPGDTASMPAVYESRNLKSEKQVSQAISGAAFGGFFGSVSVALFCLLMVNYLDAIKHFYSTALFLALLTLASFVIIRSAGNKVSVSLLLFVAGFVLGLVGYNRHLDTPILVFSNEMYAGLPTAVVLTTLFAVPNIAFYLNYFKSNKKDPNKESNSVLSIYFLNPIKSTFFSIVGFITGMVPGLTTIMSSMVCYNIMSYFTKDPVRRIVASEVGNNAGAFSCLLPLLIFGVPIAGSEAILLFFLEQNGFSNKTIEIGPLMGDLVNNYLLINLIGLILAWPLSNLVKYFYCFDLRYVFGIVLVLLFLSLMYSAWDNHSVWYYSVLMIILTPIGVALRNLQMLPLVFAYLISERYVGSLIIFKQLYF